jgi:hypothetical protein
MTLDITPSEGNEDELASRTSLLRQLVGAPRKRPPRWTPSELKRLSAKGRRLYDARRIDWHSAERIIPTPTVTAAVEAIESRLLLNSAVLGTRRPICLDGPADMGKTAILRRFLRERGRRLLEEPDPPNLGEGAIWIPHVYVGLPPHATRKDIARALHRWLQNPYSEKASANVLMDSATRSMQESCTQAVLLDDIHRVLTLRGSLYEETMSQLKNLADRFTLIMVGVGLEAKGFFNDAQIGERCQRLAVEPFAYKTDEDERQWRVLMHYFEEELVLARHPQGWLTTEAAADAVYARTAGYMGSVKELLRSAALQAIASGDERLTLDLIKSTPLGYNADERGPQGKAAVVVRRSCR